ncbi:MAG: RNA polymerase subunit sigma-70 [Rubrivivax sp.]|nr:RNA polymerase subunit sigma-70 [Rubrivivax sp.]
MTGAAAARAAEQAVRQHRGRLVAWLAWQWRDIAAAEDALAEATARALARWPVDGVPASPAGWLLATARHELLMAARRQRLAEDPALTILWPTADTPADEPAAVPDQRLALLFVCAHPAIDPQIHSALMLQVVLGLDAARIASAFLVKPDAMGKRLTRAKAKVKATGIRFELPEARELPERMAAVLEAIYAAYTLHWDAAEPHAGALAVGEDAGDDLATEALFLAELVAAQQPDSAEALGLVALLSLCEARRPARRDAAGAFVPLDEQQPSAWDARLVDAAHEALRRAAALQQPGPFQLEACIQALHMHGRRQGRVDWPDIVALYDGLIAMAPTLGAHIGHAVALARATEIPRRGLQALDALAEAHAERLTQHQPWWAARAHLLAAAGEAEEARVAYDRAIALTVQPALRAWLAKQRGISPSSSR